MEAPTNGSGLTGFVIFLHFDWDLYIEQNFLTSMSILLALATKTNM